MAVKTCVATRECQSFDRESLKCAFMHVYIDLLLKVFAWTRVAGGGVNAASKAKSSWNNKHKLHRWTLSLFFSFLCGFNVYSTLEKERQFLRIEAVAIWAFLSNLLQSNNLWYKKNLKKAVHSYFTYWSKGECKSARIKAQHCFSRYTEMEFREFKIKFHVSKCSSYSVFKHKTQWKTNINKTSASPKKHS